jgi:hypothetical protein
VKILQKRQKFLKNNNLNEFCSIAGIPVEIRKNRRNSDRILAISMGHIKFPEIGKFGGTPPEIWLIFFPKSSGSFS